MSGPILRHGRRVPIHLYEQHGAEPSDRDEPVGSVWDEQWARRIVEAMAADPGEVVHLRELVGHYRRRGEMTPSTRQSILDEDANVSSEPERSAYGHAAQSLAGNLTDTEGIHWTMQTARRLGIDDRLAADLVRELADQIREHGRPLTERTVADLLTDEDRRAMHPTVPDYVNHYHQHWAHLVQNPDGTLNLDQVMRELSDYSMVMDNATEVYSELAGLSKPNTAAVHILQGAEDKYREVHAEHALDYLLDGMETAGDRQAVIDYANDLHAGAYEQFKKDRAMIAAFKAKASSNAST